MIAPVSASIKTVGSNAQLSLGNQFAGRQVLVEKREPGVMLVRSATVVSDNERWLLRPGANADPDRALAWAAAANPGARQPAGTAISSAS